MPSTTLAELFAAGAEYIYGGLRATTQFGTEFLQRLASRLGAEGLQPSPGTFNLFTNIMERGYAAAQRVQSRTPINLEDVPIANVGLPERRIVTTGLARIQTSGEVGGRAIQGSLPFTFYDIDIIGYEEIISRIQRAVSAGIGEAQDFYREDVSRLEKLIQIAQIKREGAEYKADMWSIIQHGM